MGVLFWLSSRERGLDLGRWGLWELSDKWQHMIGYSILGMLLFRAFRGNLAFPAVPAVLCATLVGAAYGVLDEMHQRFVPGRTMDPRDAVADVVGTLAGAVLVALAVGLARRIREGVRGRA
jgi:VanZ family protein